MQVVVHFLPVGRNPRGAVVREGQDGFRQQPDGLQKIVGDHRHKYVQLEIPLGSRHPDGRVVAHYLNRHHGHLLALRGVHLAGHDGAARLVFRDPDLPQAAPRPGSQPAHVVGDLHHIRRHGLHRAVGKGHLILGGQGVEFVFCGHKAPARQGGDFLRGFLSESFRSVQPGAHGGSAQRQLLQRSGRHLHQLNVPLQGAAPPADLLGESHRHRVLQVRAPALDDALVLRLQPPENRDQLFRRGNQPVFQCQHAGDMQRRGKGIVAALAHVHVVVGVAQLFPGDFVGPVGDHLVGVHVALGAAACLPDHQGKMSGKLPADHLVRRGGNRPALLLRHPLGLQGKVRPGRRFFQDTEGVDNFRRHGFNPYADGKILMAALRLSAPVFFFRNPDFSHGVMFNPIAHIFSFRAFPRLILWCPSVSALCGSGHSVYPFCAGLFPPAFCFHYNIS